MSVDAGGYIGRMSIKINIDVKASGCRRNCHIAQDRTDAGADFGHVVMNARFVTPDGIPVDHEELLLRIGPAENIDQHAAKLTGCEMGLPLRHLGIGRKLR